MENGELPEGGYRTVARRTFSPQFSAFFRRRDAYDSIQYINGHCEVLQLKRWQSPFLRIMILCKLLFPLDKDRYGSLITDSLRFAMTMTTQLPQVRLISWWVRAHPGKKSDCFAPSAKVFNAPMTPA